MGWFTPNKRHANSFNYTPRYYDPVKEARELRRAELRGERLDDDSEYTPGKYIRAKREARDLKRQQAAKKNSFDKRMKMWIMLVGVLLVLALIYILVPRLGAIFELATTNNAGSSQREFERQQQEIKEFDPYAPLIIVPNDYEEGDEIEIIE